MLLLTTAKTHATDVASTVELDVSKMAQRLVNGLPMPIQSKVDTRSVLANLDSAISLALQELTSLSTQLADKEKDTLESLRKKKEDLTRELTELKSKYTTLVEALEKFNRGLIDLKVVSPIPMDSNTGNKLSFLFRRRNEVFSIKRQKIIKNFQNYLVNLKICLSRFSEILHPYPIQESLKEYLW